MKKRTFLLLPILTISLFSCTVSKDSIVNAVLFSHSYSMQEANTTDTINIFYPYNKKHIAFYELTNEIPGNPNCTMYTTTCIMKKNTISFSENNFIRGNVLQGDGEKYLNKKNRK